MSKKQDLLKLFGVENMVTPKTLVNETKADVDRKKPNDCAWDIRALLDELTVRVSSKDIVGCIDCLKAIRLRLDKMDKVAEEIRKSQGK